MTLPTRPDGRDASTPAPRASSIGSRACPRRCAGATCCSCTVAWRPGTASMTSASPPRSTSGCGPASSKPAGTRRLRRLSAAGIDRVVFGHTPQPGRTDALPRRPLAGHRHQRGRQPAHARRCRPGADTAGPVGDGVLRGASVRQHRDPRRTRRHAPRASAEQTPAPASSACSARTHVPFDDDVRIGCHHAGRVDQVDRWRRLSEVLGRLGPALPPALRRLRPAPRGAPAPATPAPTSAAPRGRRRSRRPRSPASDPPRTHGRAHRPGAAARSIGRGRDPQVRQRIEGMRVAAVLRDDEGGLERRRKRRQHQFDRWPPALVAGALLERHVDRGTGRSLPTGLVDSCRCPGRGARPLSWIEKVSTSGSSQKSVWVPSPWWTSRSR